MRVSERKQSDDGKNLINFIRVDLGEIDDALEDVIKTLKDLSWINKLNCMALEESYNVRANGTIAAIEKEFKKHKGGRISGDIGEYLVSVIANEVIESELKYVKMPIIEIIEKKLTQNPGFDLAACNDTANRILFGEAKYIFGKNAYGSALTQIVKFIKLKKDIAEIASIQNFFKNEALDNVCQGKKGFIIAFSSLKTDSSELIENIEKNENYKEILKYEEIVIVAVDLNESDE